MLKTDALGKPGRFTFGPLPVGHFRALFKGPLQKQICSLFSNNRFWGLFLSIPGPLGRFQMDRACKHSPGDLLSAWEFDSGSV